MQTSFDFITNSVMMPIIALLTCIIIAYIKNPSLIIDEVSLSGSFRQRPMYTVMLKYVAPVCLVVILVFAILEGVGVIKV